MEHLSSEKRSQKVQMLKLYIIIESPKQNFPAIFEIVHRIYQISRDILESSNDLDTKKLPKSAFTRLSYLTKVRIHLCNRKIITVCLKNDSPFIPIFIVVYFSIQINNAFSIIIVGLTVLLNSVLRLFFDLNVIQNGVCCSLNVGIQVGLMVTSIGES